MKTDLFLFCGHCWVFQICWHSECSTFTASSFRIWNGSTGIPSPPLALFVVMLSKAHLTSYSRMSGSRWVFTPSSLSGSWRSSFFLELFIYCSPVPYWAPTNLGSSSFSFLSFCLFKLFMGFSRQEYWSGFPFPSPVDHILSELSTMTCLSWVALHGMAHSFIESDKAVVLVTNLPNISNSQQTQNLQEALLSNVVLVLTIFYYIVFKIGSCVSLLLALFSH